MNDIDQGKLQTNAGIRLLLNSHLVVQEQESPKLRSAESSSFESKAISIDAELGRYLCWILFSTGAELLLKGVCLERGVEIYSDKEVPDAPTVPLLAWAKAYLIAPNLSKAKTGPVKHFGTLGDFTRDDGKLLKLFKKVKANSDEETMVRASYLYLQKTIRNRDLHAYIPNVRSANFGLVQELFVDSFNILIGWLPTS